MFTTNIYEVRTSNYRGNLSHIGPETEELYCFHYATLNFERKLPKRALFADRRPLRKDTIASRDRFRPMGARQNLALYCTLIMNQDKRTGEHKTTDQKQANLTRTLGNLLTP